MRPARLAVLAAVAVRRALQQFGATDIAIKWPNDLMRGERKVGGLLLELVNGPDGSRCLVLGIGLNLAVAAADLPAELAERAGSLNLAAENAPRAALIEALWEELHAALAQIGTEADRSRGAEYAHASWLNGRHVRLTHAGEQRSATICAVTEDGDLLLDDGSVLSGERVELLEVAARP